MAALIAGGARATNPTFAPAPGSPFAVGSNPQSLAAADLNRDGKPDLAVANYGSSDLSILLGDGLGGFSPAGPPVAVASNPQSLAAEDLNRDGTADLVAANDVSNNVSILLGDGMGGFSPAGSPVAVGSNPSSVVAADLNRDGKPDLAVANYGSNNVSILLGDGLGGFSPAGSPVAAGSNPASLAAADLNRDGRPDLAVANLVSNNLSILLGDGTGGFSPAGAPVGAGAGPISVSAGDVNGDGRLDLAVANLFSNDVSILLGNGDGGFVAPPGSPVAAGSNPASLAVADLSRDGKPDLAVANSGSATVSILLNTTPLPTDVSFEQGPGSPLNAGGSPASLAAADLNRDGKADLAVAVNNLQMSTADLLILLGDGAGGFSETCTVGVCTVVADHRPTSIAAADLNRDGNPDLAITSVPTSSGAGNFVTILLGDGAGLVTFGSTYVVGSDPSAVAAADLNRDGNPDLAVANSGSGDVSILLGDGAGGFTPAPGSPVAAPNGPIALAVADLNRDGSADLAVAHFGSGDVAILLGNGAGGFSPAPGSPIATGSNATSVAAADLDRDGDADLAVTNLGSSNVAILLGNGAGGFSPAPGSPVPTGSDPRSVAAADLDADGRSDLAVANHSSNDVSILLGNGTGGFNAAPDSPVAVGGIHPFSLATADLNRDGRPDLAVANIDSLDISILLQAAQPTAVTLATFAAKRTRQGVELRWRTAQEASLLGFNVYRAGVKVNRMLVTARGARVGATYRLLDRGARRGVTYAYRLQAVRVDGTRAWIGRSVTRR